MSIINLNKPGVVDVFFRGNGGDGIITANTMLSEAMLHQYLNGNGFAQTKYLATAVQKIGAERRGSPVKSEMRFAHDLFAKELDVTQIEKADFLVFFNDGALGDENNFLGCKGGETLIVNSPLKAEELVEKYQNLKKFDLYSVDATGWFKLAFRQVKGREPSDEETRPNVPMNYAFSAVAGLVDYQSLDKVLNNSFKGDALKINKSVSSFIDENISYSPRKDFTELKLKGNGFEEKRILGPAYPSWGSSGMKTGIYRRDYDVVIDENCSKCGTCIDVCPEGVIGREEKGVRIDQEYCKGCKVCIQECPKGAIKIYERDGK